MQIVWYLAAVGMVGLALWPVRRSSQLICVIDWTGFTTYAQPASSARPGRARGRCPRR